MKVRHWGGVHLQTWGGGSAPPPSLPPWSAAYVCPFYDEIPFSLNFVPPLLATFRCRCRCRCCCFWAAASKSRHKLSFKDHCRTLLIVRYTVIFVPTAPSNQNGNLGACENGRSGQWAHHDAPLGPTCAMGNRARFPTRWRCALSGTVSHIVYHNQCINITGISKSLGESSAEDISHLFYVGHDTFSGPCLAFSGEGEVNGSLLPHNLA